MFTEYEFLGIVVFQRSMF